MMQPVQQVATSFGIRRFSAISRDAVEGALHSLTSATHARESADLEMSEPLAPAGGLTAPQASTSHGWRSFPLAPSAAVAAESAPALAGSSCVRFRHLTVWCWPSSIIDTA